MIKLGVTSVGYKKGKTFVSAGLASTMQSLGYATCVYKPVHTGGIEKNGFMQAQDLTFVTSMDPYVGTKFSYLFKSEQEPVIAAEFENTRIDKYFIQNEFNVISEKYDCGIVDGNGGIASPLGVNFSEADLFCFLRIPVIIVVTPQKDTVNEAILTINYAQQKNVEVRGVVINDYPEFSSDECIKNIPRLIEEYTDSKILGIIEHLKNPYNSSDLITTILNGTDVESIFNIKIEKLGMC